MKETTKKILIVEDEELISRVLAERFTLIRGMKVLIAKDGMEGLEMALKEKPDLVLLDIILPKLGGIEVLKKMRQNEWGKNVKVIVMSNLSDSEKEQAAKNLGVNQYIIKADLEIERLAEMVIGCL